MCVHLEHTEDNFCIYIFTNNCTVGGTFCLLHTSFILSEYLVSSCKDGVRNVRKCAGYCAKSNTFTVDGSLYPGFH